MRTVPARFPSGELTLEGEWLLPDGEPPFPAVVVCHPYPPQGGTMGNHVVLSICDALADRAIAAFRFNFRGVGESQGQFDGGPGEMNDVRAALDYVYASNETDKQRLGLAGYSFGGIMALGAAADDSRVARLAVVSSPLSPDDRRHLRETATPFLYLVGDRDQMVPPESYRQMKDETSDPEWFQLLAGADHFLAGYETEVGRRVAGFFAAGFNSS